MSRYYQSYDHYVSGSSRDMPCGTQLDNIERAAKIGYDRGLNGMSAYPLIPEYNIGAYLGGHAMGVIHRREMDQMNQDLYEFALNLEEPHGEA